MTFAVSFSPPVDFVRSELAGNASKLSPIPVDLDGDGVEELVAAADTGFIYIAGEAGAPAWSGDFVKIVDVPGAIWAGPPVFCDIDGDGTLEIFITSRDATLYAFEPSGAPFAIDDDGSPGTLKLRGDLATSPIALNVDSDAHLEIIVFSSNTDSTFATVLGSSAHDAGKRLEAKRERSAPTRSFDPDRSLPTSDGHARVRRHQGVCHLLEHERCGS